MTLRDILPLLRDVDLDDLNPLDVANLLAHTAAILNAVAGGVALQHVNRQLDNEKPPSKPSPSSSRRGGSSSLADKA